jgi:hypothetical protein
MAIANTMLFPKHFDRNIAKIFFDAGQELPSEYDKVFKIEDAPAGRDYTEAELSGLGELLAINEGRGVEYDTPVEGNEKTRYYSKFGRGFQITEEMYKDDLFGNFKKLPRALAKSGRNKLETTAWDVLNNGFSTSLGWDGKALFANNHATLKSGTTINNVAATDLSTTSLQAAFDYFDNAIDHEGFPKLIKPKVLVVPAASKWVANDLLKATGRVWDYARMNAGDVAAGTGTAGFPAANANNMLLPKNGVVDDWSIFVCHYLDDSDSWFLLGEDFDLRILFKERIRMQSYDDFDTGSMKFKVTTRFAAFANRYQEMYGSAGAS